MKLQFKHQKFQADAAKAVVDVFAGQPFSTPSYMMDTGYDLLDMADVAAFTGWRNEPVTDALSDGLVEVLRRKSASERAGVSGKRKRGGAPDGGEGGAAAPPEGGPAEAGEVGAPDGAEVGPAGAGEVWAPDGAEVEPPDGGEVGEVGEVGERVLRRARLAW